jgi:hypothetical protein
VTEEPRGAPAGKQRPIWKLNRDEQRTLIITFVGGLASIIFGAVILGSAIAVAKATAKPGQAGAWALVAALAVVFAAQIPLVLALQAALLRGVRQPVGRGIVRVVALAGVAGAILGLAITLLALIGLAAGIH